MGAHKVRPVQLIPHHAVVKAGRLLHQPGGKLLLGHGAFQQKAEGLHLDGTGDLGLLLAGAGLGRPDAVVVGNHQIGVGFLRPLYHQLGGVGLDGVVRVHKLQVLALRLPQSQIAGGRHAAVGLVNDHDAVIHPCEHFAHFQTHILRAVVEQ